jgi:hypothetical protein
MRRNSNDVSPKLVLFDIGGVIIDLDFHDARSTLELSAWLMRANVSGHSDILAVLHNDWQFEILW